MRRPRRWPGRPASSRMRCHWAAWTPSSSILPRSRTARSPRRRVPPPTSFACPSASRTSMISSPTSRTPSPLSPTHPFPCHPPRKVRHIWGWLAHKGPGRRLCEDDKKLSLD
ncbi:exported protein of unknown function [Microbacterium sp. Nx66]|nr:exported protein of unknown function [Microbacterium sp. Nx66]